MNQRIRLNLGTFAVLAFALSVWGLLTFLQVGPLAPDTTQVTAQFEQSPGLQQGFPVTYKGIQVGAVVSIELATGMVEVGLELDPAQDVPAAVGATVRRRSVVGEPYVALDLLDGHTSDGPILQDGSVIPIEDTDLLISYEEVFSTVDDLLAQIPADDLNVVLRELRAALDGRVETVQSLLVDVESTTATLAARTELLEALTREATRLTGTLAGSAGAINRGVDNTAVLASILEENVDRLSTLLRTTPGVLAMTTEVLTQVEPPLQCALASAENIAAAADPRLGEYLDEVFAVSPTFAAILDAIVKERADGAWINVRALLDDGSNTGPTFDTRRELPVPPAPASCEQGQIEPGRAGAAAGSAGWAAGTQPTGRTADRASLDEAGIATTAGSEPRPAPIHAAGTGATPWYALTAPRGPAALTAGLLLGAWVVVWRRVRRRAAR